MGSNAATLTPRALRAAGPFVALGALLVVIGALTWIADSWPLRIGGLLAIVVGAYVLLGGLGLYRVRREQRQAAAEATVDGAVLATAASATASGTACAGESACATCDTVCALRH